MKLLTGKVARLAAGAAIVGGAGGSAYIASAYASPHGSHYGVESGYEAENGGQGHGNGYGHGDESGYGEESGYGAEGLARGHRLHCPSYQGMVHSHGHAKCHEAPRGHAAGADDADKQSGTSVSGANLSSTTSSTAPVTTSSTTASTAPKANTSKTGDDADKAQVSDVSTTSTTAAKSTTSTTCDQSKTQATQESTTSTTAAKATTQDSQTCTCDDGSGRAGSNSQADSHRGGNHSGSTRD